MGKKAVLVVLVVLVLAASFWLVLVDLSLTVRFLQEVRGFDTRWLWSMPGLVLLWTLVVVLDNALEGLTSGKRRRGVKNGPK